MELYTLFPGECLVLQCLAQDETPVVGLAVIWTKDHAAVLNGDHMRVNGGQLEIGSVELTDSGLYSCTVQSLFGNHSTYFIVNVTGMSCRSLEGMSFVVFILIEETHFFTNDSICGMDINDIWLVKQSCSTFQSKRTRTQLTKCHTNYYWRRNLKYI